jgi:hypothetical protein
MCIDRGHTGQKTKITGVESLNEFGYRIHGQQDDVPIAGERSLASTEASDSGILNRTAQENGEAVFYRGLSSRGLPCTAAFACTDYKVQGRTLERVALELRGTRTTNVHGQAIPSQCDPYSLYVQLSRSRSLEGIMLLSKVRERDIIGNTVPENMVAAEKRLEELSEATIWEAESWDWSSAS